MVERTFNIKGMTCASCVQTVEKAMKKLPGVQDANVNLATEKLNIIFDENAVSVREIQATVEKVGYKALVDIVQKTFVITGMTCASCVQSIEKATRKLEGVMNSNVNLATGKMVIEYDPTIVSVSDIIEAVSSAGYEALEDAETSGLVNEERDKKQKKQKLYGLDFGVQQFLRYHCSILRWDIW